MIIQQIKLTIHELSSSSPARPMCMNAFRGVIVNGWLATAVNAIPRKPVPGSKWLDNAEDRALSLSHYSSIIIRKSVSEPVFVGILMLCLVSYPIHHT